MQFRYAEFIGTLLFVFFVGFARNEPLAVGLAYGVLGEFALSK